MVDQTLTQTFLKSFAPSLAEARSSELRYLLMQNIVRACEAKDGGKGWTLSQLAEKLGVNKSQVSRMLSGIANPTLETIAKYEAALETVLLEINREDSYAFAEAGLESRPPAAAYRATITVDDYPAEDLAKLGRGMTAWHSDPESAVSADLVDGLMAA